MSRTASRAWLIYTPLLGLVLFCAAAWATFVALVCGRRFFDSH